jgi:predicted HD phosphohydrolase
MKAFLTTLFIKQNKWHNHSVLVHTLKVAYHAIQHKDYKFIIPALLHDLGKPVTAFQDEKDLLEGTYSFTDHEEKSYQIIKNWSFISEWTKDVVRYHYIIRDISKSYKKGKIDRYNEKLAIWNNLSPELKKDIETFMKYDDMGKK